MKKLPSARLLRRLIDYDPATGEMRWKERPVWMFAPGNRGRQARAKWWMDQLVGKPALATLSGGYRNGEIFSINVRAHRAAWAIYYGEWPVGEIDHINGIRDDNRISNLRDVPQAENLLNKRLPKHNKSGVIGVSWYPRTQRWAVDIGVSGKRIRIGYFKSLKEAADARKRAEIKHGYHPNHGRAA